MSWRVDSLIKTIEPEILNKASQSVEHLLKELEANRDSIVSSFNNAFTCGLEKVALAQPDKGKIEYIHMSYLLSSLLTGKFELRIDFYNNERYLDEIETEAYWTADFIASYFEEDFRYFQSLLKKEHVRVKDYEVRNLAVDFGGLYLSAFAVSFQSILTELPVNRFLHLFEEQVSIVYGGFQDKSMPISTINLQGST